MVIGFKERFVSKILEKRKIHTIRQDGLHRWMPGSKIHFATGVRTKKYNQFYKGRCVSTQKIKIVHNFEYMNDSKVFVDGRLLSESEMQKLAWNDGFECIAEFMMWFNNDFSDKIIHWTDYKY